MTILTGVWKRVEKGLKFIGLIQSSIILGIFYYLILGAVAIPYQIVKLFKPEVKNPRTYWQSRRVDDVGGLWQQF